MKMFGFLLFILWVGSSCGAVNEVMSAGLKAWDAQEAHRNQKRESDRRNRQKGFAQANIFGCVEPEEEHPFADQSNLLGGVRQPAPPAETPPPPQKKYVVVLRTPKPDMWEVHDMSSDARVCKLFLSEGPAPTPEDITFLEGAIGVTSYMTYTDKESSGTYVDLQFDLPVKKKSVTLNKQDITLTFSDKRKKPTYKSSGGLQGFQCVEAGAQKAIISLQVRQGMSIDVQESVDNSRELIFLFPKDVDLEKHTFLFNHPMVAGAHVQPAANYGVLRVIMDHGVQLKRTWTETDENDPEVVVYKIMLVRKNETQGGSIQVPQKVMAPLPKQEMSPEQVYDKHAPNMTTEVVEDGWTPSEMDVDLTQVAKVAQTSEELARTTCVAPLWLQQATESYKRYKSLREGS